MNTITFTCWTHVGQAAKIDLPYGLLHTYAVAIECSGRRYHKPSTLRTFCRLKMCAYKKARQIGLQLVRIQSVLYDVANEQNSCVFEHLNLCGLEKGCKQIGITNEYKFEQRHVR